MKFWDNSMNYIKLKIKKTELYGIIITNALYKKFALINPLKVRK